MAGKARLILLLLLVPFFAQAEEGCPTSYLVIDQTVEWNFAEDSHADFYLPYFHNQWGRWIQTAAAAHFSTSDDTMNSFFDFSSNLRTLPYNVYRFDLMIGEPGSADAFVKSVDYSNDCAGDPKSMYPGDIIKGFPFKIPPHADGKPRGQEPVRIRVWGHLH